MDRRHIISGFFWLCIAIFVLIKSFELGFGTFSAPGSGFTFFWSSLILGILSIILVFKSLLGKGDIKHLKELWKDLKWRKPFLTIMMVVLYSLILNKLGFILATFFLMAFLFWIGRLKYWVTLLSALITILLSYIIFHFILQIQFPRGILGW